MSKIFVDQVDPKTATTLTLGTSGDTVSIPSGVTLSGAGTITPSAVNLAGTGAGGITGNLPVANLNSGTSASSSTFWRGDGTWVAAGGNNTPAFQAKLSANQNPTDLTWTVVGCNTEVFDTDSCYDTTTYRFTPTTAGKYYVYWALTADISTVPSLKQITAAIAKNGTRQDTHYLSQNDNNWINIVNTGAVVIDMDGSSDYIDLQGYIDVSTGNSYFYAGSYFGAYLLIGV